MKKKLLRLGSCLLLVLAFFVKVYECVTQKRYFGNGELCHEDTLDLLKLTRRTVICEILPEGLGLRRGIMQAGHAEKTRGDESIRLDLSPCSIGRDSNLEMSILKSMG